LPSAPSGALTERVEKQARREWEFRWGLPARSNRTTGPGLIAAAVALAVPVVSDTARFGLRAKHPVVRELAADLRFSAGGTVNGEWTQQHGVSDRAAPRL